MSLLIFLGGRNMKKERIRATRHEFKNVFLGCDTFKKFERVAINGAKSFAYDRAVGLQDILKMILWTKEAEESDLWDFCCQLAGYEPSLGYNPNEDVTVAFSMDEQTSKLKALEMYRRYRRYIKSEKRRSRENLMVTMNLQEKDCEVGNFAVAVRPQALFMKKTADGVRLEAVFYSDRQAPSGLKEGANLLQEVRFWDLKNQNKEFWSESHPARIKSVPKWADSFWGLRYIEALMEDIPFLTEAGISPEDKVHAVGSMYFMKMKSNDEQFDSSSFFEGNGNIYSLEENLTAGDTACGCPEIEKLFELWAERQETGMEDSHCTEQDCAKCRFEPACRFQKDFEPLELEVSSNASTAFEMTPAQAEVIGARSGCYMVIAKAGSGKTATLKELVISLIREGVDPSRILMVSFTNASVKDFQERVLSTLREKDPLANADFHCQTFHGLAMEIIRNNFEPCGYRRAPGEMNPVENVRIVADIIRGVKIPGSSDLYKTDFENNPNVLGIAVRAFGILSENPEWFSESMKQIQSVEDRLYLAVASELTTVSTMQTLVDLYDEYVQEIREAGIIMYSQMEPVMHEFLQKNPEYLRDTYGFEYVILDEFQDSNSIQMETVQLLKKDAQLLIAVADDGQSIYGWRGGDVTNVTSFAEKLGCQPDEVKIIRLAENFRSSAEIPELADKVLALNSVSSGTATVAVRGANGTPPVIKGFHSSDDEAKFIIGEIKRLHDEEGIEYHRIAVIQRNNAPLIKMAALFGEQGIPFSLKNPMKYSDNSRVKAALSLVDNIYYQPETNEGYFAYLSALHNGGLFEDLSSEEIQEALQEMSDRYRNIDLFDISRQERLVHEALDALKGNDEIYSSFLDEYVYSYEVFEEQLRFLRDFKKYGRRMAKRATALTEGVVGITAHSSKGLEFDVVFVCITDFDSPILHNGHRHLAEVEETRRLLYVAMTRARDLLYVTGQFIVPGTKTRSARDGGPCYNRFLEEVMTCAGMIYDPVDHEAKKKKARKSTKTDPVASSGNSGGMTEEQILEYQRRTAGAAQMSF